MSMSLKEADLTQKLGQNITPSAIFLWFRNIFTKLIPFNLNFFKSNPGLTHKSHTQNSHTYPNNHFYTFLSLRKCVYLGTGRISEK